MSYRSLTSEVAYLVADSGATALVHDDSAVVGPALPELTGLLGSWHADDDSLWAGPATAADRRLPRRDRRHHELHVRHDRSPEGHRARGAAARRRVPAEPARRVLGLRAVRRAPVVRPGVPHRAGRLRADAAWARAARSSSCRASPRSRASSSSRRERVTTSHMVPANFIRILEAPWEDYDLTSVKKILHAAAPCPPAVKRRIMEVFPPGTVWEYYGASEGMCTVISPEEWLRKPGSVGRAFPGLEITIRDDDGNALPPGEVGSVYASGDAGHAQVRVPQRAREDRRRVAGQRVHRGRPRFARRGRLPVPRRPPRRPHPPRRREHLPRRGRARAGDAPRRRRLRGVRAPRRAARPARARHRRAPIRAPRRSRRDRSPSSRPARRRTSSRRRSSSSTSCRASRTARC